MNPAPAMKRLFRKPLLWLVLVIILGGGIASGGWAILLQVTGNIHTVAENEVYRSARLSTDELESLIKANSIKSIINLEGPDKGKDWYEAETALASRLGVAYTEFDWSASRIVTPAEVDAFLAATASLPKPILLHCKSGADRTGLASALYLAAVKKADESTALGQLSFRYGHVSLPYTSAYAMDETWARERIRFNFKTE